MSISMYITNKKHGTHKVSIDVSDIGRILFHRWFLLPRKAGYYAGTKHKGKNILMHRYILELPAGEPWVDHIDRNGLNNKRSNLRLATPRINNLNRSMPKTNVTGIKGVAKIKNNKKIYRAKYHLPNGDEATLPTNDLMMAAKFIEGCKTIFN